MEKTNRNNLRAAVEGLYGCKAQYASDIEVSEYFKNETVWQGTISVFDLAGNPSASACYAWYEPIKNSEKRRFFAVLKAPPVNSPEAAVRASIMADHQKSKQV